MGGVLDKVLNEAYSSPCNALGRGDPVNLRGEAGSRHLFLL